MYLKVCELAPFILQKMSLLFASASNLYVLLEKIAHYHIKTEEFYIFVSMKYMYMSLQNDDLMHMFFRFDIYRKVPKDLTQPTLTGAWISICSVAFIMYLFVAELIGFLQHEV